MGTGVKTSPEVCAQVGQLLLDPKRPLKERFRALFTLKSIGGQEAVDWMAKAFDDESALLKHEVAYCLGQLQSDLALPILTSVLADVERQEPIVRHEAAEALAAIGGEEALRWVKKYQEDPSEEVRETCQLALAKLNLNREESEDEHEGNVWGSHDPAPPSKEKQWGPGKHPGASCRPRLFQCTFQARDCLCSGPGGLSSCIRAVVGQAEV